MTSAFICDYALRLRLLKTDDPAESLSVPCDKIYAPFHHASALPLSFLLAPMPIKFAEKVFLRSNRIIRKCVQGKEPSLTLGADAIAGILPLYLRMTKLRSAGTDMGVVTPNENAIPTNRSLRCRALIRPDL